MKFFSCRLRHTLSLLLTTIVALSAVTPARAANSSPVVIDPEFFGMVVRDPYYDYDSYPGLRGVNTVAQDEMGRRLEQLGVRWVRIEFIGDGGGVHFPKYDYFIKQVAPRHNLKVLGLIATPILQGDPQGYWDFKRMNTEPTTDTLRPEFGSGLNTYMRRWLEESLKIARQYNGYIQAYELFNEANRLLGDGSSLPANISYAGLNPTRVGRLQAKFYRICKNTDGQQREQLCSNETKIILGGLHPKGTSARRNPGEPEKIVMTDREYLRQIYGPGGFEDFKNADPQGRWPVDGIGYHPYPEEISLVDPLAIDIDLFKIQERMTKMRQMLNTLGDGNRPFWITEIGYNAGFWKVRNQDPEPEQARFLREVYLQLWARGDVANVFWFKYEDFPPANPVGGADPQRWGVVRIPFREGSGTTPPTVNGIPCAGGACYEPGGKPDKLRLAFYIYRELSGLAVQRLYLPQALR